MRCRRAFALATILAATFASATSARLAHADDVVTAAEWKKRGDDAMDAGRAAEALAAYRRAAEIEPSPSLDYNVGRALLAVGDFTAALQAFERYDATAPDDLKKKTHRLSEVMADLGAKIATVTITGDDQTTGARVSLRGAAVGALPLAPFRANAGRAELRVEREGFEPFVEALDLPPGGATLVRVVLRPERPIARLGIVATPSGARVAIDGEARGAAPLDLELAPGAHQLVVSAPKHDARTMSLTLARGETRRVDLTLPEKPPPITERWWFWTGVGVVLTGAAIAVIAASVERAPNTGSLGTFHVP